MEKTAKPRHIGRNISRIRELRGIKQEALAFSLGISQKTVSMIEHSETVDEEKLEQIAKELGVTSEAIKNFTEEAVMNFFNNFYDNSSSQGNNFGSFGTSNLTFNPLDKLVEAYTEKEQLYERLLQAEKDKVAYLELLLQKK